MSAIGRVFTRWRFRYSLRWLFVLPLICALPCMWVIWPRLTANAFLSALAQERTEDAIAMIAQSPDRPYHSLLTHLRLDAQLEIVRRLWQEGAVEPQARSMADVFRGRQTFTIPRYLITVERGRIVEEQSELRD
jgi:hypothetical protein